MRKALMRLQVLLAIPLVGTIIADSWAHVIRSARTAPTTILLTALFVVRLLHWAGVYVDQGELFVNIGLGSKRSACLACARKDWTSSI